MNTADQGPKADRSGGGSFWTSVPGILTGLATLVTAGAGVFAAINATSGDGGGGGGASATTSVSEIDEENGAEVTRAAWAEDANAICVETNEQVNALGLAQATTPEEVVTIIATVDPILSDAVERFRSLEPPTGDEVSVERMIGLNEQSLTSFRSAASSFSAGDVATGYSLIEQAIAADQRWSEIARQLGADECDAYTY
jgi:hypothetical protein